MANKQLYEKSGEEYVEVYPLTYAENVTDSGSGKTVTELLQDVNHLYLTYTTNSATTRLTVPSDRRRFGLWISYMKDNALYTEAYIGATTNVTTDSVWSADSNWQEVSIDGSSDGETSVTMPTVVFSTVLGTTLRVTTAGGFALGTSTTERLYDWINAWVYDTDSTGWSTAWTKMMEDTTLYISGSRSAFHFRISNPYDSLGTLFSNDVDLLDIIGTYDGTTGGTAGLIDQYTRNKIAGRMFTLWNTRVSTSTSNVTISITRPDGDQSTSDISTTTDTLTIPAATSSTAGLLTPSYQVYLSNYSRMIRTLGTILNELNSTNSGTALGTTISELIGTFISDFI